MYGPEDILIDRFMLEVSKRRHESLSSCSHSYAMCSVFPRDSGYRGRWQNSSSSYHVSSSRSTDRIAPYRKRPRDDSWSSPSSRGYSSSRYSRGGRDYSHSSRASMHQHSSYGRQSGGADPMNLLVGLSQMLR